MAVWVVLLTHWVAVLGMGVPLQAPAAVDVAVVLPQPEVQRAAESRVSVMSASGPLTKL